ncbi:MAG: metallophosphoesterase, partial [Candidatus Baltobacteraceae bacterium]
VTPGNHDLAFQDAPDLRRVLDAKFPRITTLIDEFSMVADLKLYASPYQPWFHDWAYNFSRGPAGERQAKEKWAQIPDDTAILVTHGPAYGILDMPSSGKHAGCSGLKARLAQLSQLRLHVFGHIHESHGVQRRGNVLHVNACICDSQYDPIQKPIAITGRDGRFDGAVLSLTKVRKWC